MISKKRMN